MYGPELFHFTLLVMSGVHEDTPGNVYTVLQGINMISMQERLTKIFEGVGVTKFELTTQMAPYMHTTQPGGQTGPEVMFRGVSGHPGGH